MKDLPIVDRLEHRAKQLKDRNFGGIASAYTEAVEIIGTLYEALELIVRRQSIGLDGVEYDGSERGCIGRDAFEVAKAALAKALTD